MWLHLNSGRSFSLLILFALGLSSTLAFAAGQSTLQEAYPDLASNVLRFVRLTDLPQGTVLKADDMVIDESLLFQMVERESPEFRF